MQAGAAQAGGSAVIVAGAAGLAVGLAAGYAWGARRAAAARAGGGQASAASHEDASPGSSERVVLLLLVRSDLELPLAVAVEHAARTFNAHWKKLWRRRDPALRAWEAGGSKLDVLAASSEDDMLLVQSAARSLALPTHTWAGERARKARTVMAVGPADATALAHITQTLRKL